MSVIGATPKTRPPKKSDGAQNLEILQHKRVSAKIATARVILNLSNLLGARKCQTVELRKTAVAVFGIAWARESATGVTTDRIHNPLKRIKNPPIGPSCYERLRKLRLASYVNRSEPFPIQWVTWRNLLEKFGLVPPQAVFYLGFPGPRLGG